MGVFNFQIPVRTVACNNQADNVACNIPVASAQSETVACNNQADNVACNIPVASAQSETVACNNQADNVACNIPATTIPSALPKTSDLSETVACNNLPASVAHTNLPVAATGAEMLPAAVRAKALERLSFIRLVQSVIKTQQRTHPDAVAYVAVNHAAQFPLLVKSGKGGGSALIYNNYRNWSKRLIGVTNPDAALDALCDGYQRGMRDRKGNPKFWEYFFAFYLNRNCLPVTQAYKLACAKMRDIDKTCPVPTIAQADYQLKRLDPGALILAREGEEAYKNRCVDFIRRDWSGLRPGECLIGDSRTFDTRVKVWNAAQNKWVAVRPNIAGLLDARSWYLASYWITASPVNSETLINTLRLYFCRSGGVAPTHIYFDNGKDYCAQGFSTDFETEGHSHSIFRELGITLVNSIAYNARAKTIERAFRDMMQQFDKLFPDYLGSHPGERTLSADYYDKHPEELPTLKQFSEIFDRWLRSWHNTPKSGKIHAGKSPAEIWAQLDRSNALSGDRLRMAFFKPSAVRTVGRGPCVTYDGKEFYAKELRWGDKLLIKTDSMDPDHVMCYTPDGAFLCEARTRDRIAALALDDAEARKTIAESIARQRKQLRDAYTMLDDLTDGRYLASPIELMLATDGAKIVSGDTVSKVKGDAHSYTHHSIPAVLPPDEVPPPAPPAPPAPADEEISTWMQPPRPEPDDELDMADVHKFMVNHKQKESEDEL